MNTSLAWSDSPILTKRLVTLSDLVRITNVTPFIILNINLQTDYGDKYNDAQIQIFLYFNMQLVTKERYPNNSSIINCNEFFGKSKSLIIPYIGATSLSTIAITFVGNNVLGEDYLYSAMYIEISCGVHSENELWDPADAESIDYNTYPIDNKKYDEVNVNIMN